MSKSLIVFLFFITSAFATSFVPIPIEKQLKEATAAVHATYLGEVNKRLSNAQVVTEMSFKVIQASNLPRKYQVNSNEIKVLVPGGTWNDVVYHTHGIPKFSDEEEVVLILKEDEQGLWPMNLALAKYRIRRHREEVVLVSEVFPEHSELGNIDIKKFNEELKKVYGRPFAKIESDKVVVKMELDTEKTVEGPRKPASIEEKKEQEETSGRNSIFVIVLGILVMLAAVLRLRKN